MVVIEQPRAPVQKGTLVRSGMPWTAQRVAEYQAVLIVKSCLHALGLSMAGASSSDYESLCVVTLHPLVVDSSPPWILVSLLLPGGGPARGRLSCQSYCVCWLLDGTGMPGDCTKQSLVRDLGLTALMPFAALCTVPYAA